MNDLNIGALAPRLPPLAFLELQASVSPRSDKSLAWNPSEERLVPTSRQALGSGLSCDNHPVKLVDAWPVVLLELQ